MWMHSCLLSPVLVQLELLNDAKEALQKVLKLDKNNATALFRMGKVGVFCIATALTQAVHPLKLSNAPQVYSGQGEHKKAVQYFKMAAAEEPNEKVRCHCSPTTSGGWTSPFTLLPCGALVGSMYSTSRRCFSKPSSRLRGTAGGRRPCTGG